jgi:hypothetical protein
MSVILKQTNNFSDADINYIFSIEINKTGAKANTSAPDKENTQLIASRLAKSRFTICSFLFLLVS